MNRLILTLVMMAMLIVPSVVLAEVPSTGLMGEIKQLTDFGQTVVLEGKVLKVRNKLKSNHSVLSVPLDKVRNLYASGARVFFEGEFSEEHSGGSTQKLSEASIKVRSSQDADKLMDLFGQLVIAAKKKPVATK